jgi:rubrerythrin
MAIRVVFLALVILLIVLVVRHEKRLHARVRKMGYLFCPYCDYDLKGLPQKHVCPECGRPYDADELRREWEEAFPPETETKRQVESGTKEPPTAMR